MFFVVYFKTAKQHLVVPAIHVYKMDDVFQKFMNSSCNSNQMFLFHHPLNGYENAVNTAPNFYAEISDTFKIDEEYCFKGKIVKYFSKYFPFEYIIELNPNKLFLPRKDNYADAIEYKNHLRPFDPAVYNENRINEEPIPPTEPIPDEIEQVFVQATETSDEENVPQENDESIQIKQEPELLIMNESDEMEFDRILHGDIEVTAVQDVSDGMLNVSLEDTAEPLEQANSSVEQDHAPVEPEPVMTSARYQNDETVFDQTDLNESDEIVFGETGSFPKPMVCTEDNLTKHKDDPISGDLSYAPKVVVYQKLFKYCIY